MGRLLDGLKDAEYNPHTAVCKLPQPFRMLDKLLSRLVDDAVNLAVERDEARLAARGIAEGTEVLAPSAVVDDIGAIARQTFDRWTKKSRRDEGKATPAEPAEPVVEKS